MKLDECAGSLFARSRQGSLSPVEANALSVHLQNCESCRQLCEVASDFDKFAVTECADGGRIQQLTSVARQWAIARRRQLSRVVVPLPERNQRRARILLLASAAFLVVAGASGAILVQQVIRTEQVIEVATLETEVSLPIEAKARGIRARLGQLASAESSAALLQDDAAEAPSPAAEKTCRSGACGGAESAAVLFKQANQARRDGESKKAIGFYQALQRLYPASPEAHLSHVSLGHLLLGAGQARGSLSQFERALGSSGAASVRAEALYGKGLALAHLGRTAEEDTTWRSLLGQFPLSPYAAHARRRLGEASLEDN